MSRFPTPPFHEQPALPRGVRMLHYGLTGDVSTTLIGSNVALTDDLPILICRDFECTICGDRLAAALVNEILKEQIERSNGFARTRLEETGQNVIDAISEGGLALEHYAIPSHTTIDIVGRGGEVVHVIATLRIKVQPRSRQVNRPLRFNTTIVRTLLDGVRRQSAPAQ